VAWHQLILASACVDFHGGVSAGTAHGMHWLMAGLDRFENRLPLALDGGVIGVHSQAAL
jgi:hypothetical protein